MGDDHSQDLSSTERAELERLRAEVAGLRQSDRRVKRRPGWRTVLSIILVAVGSILLVPAVAAAWLDGVVTDTDRYVDTVSPLIDDPAVQRAVTNRVTDEVVTRMDIPELLRDTAAELSERDRLPRAAAALEGLAEPIASGFEDWLHGQVAAVVRSERFAELWAAANRAAHQQLADVMTGDDNRDAVEVSGGTVSLELGPVVAAVKERLADRGVGIAERIPTIEAQIELVHAERISTARRAFGLIDKAGWWLPVAALVLIAAGVLLARSRRRALFQAGLGAIVAMLVLALTLALARPLYLDALPSEVDPDAAGAVFDQVVSFLKSTLRVVLVLGLIVTAIAFLTGTSTAATGIRRGFNRLADRIGDGAWVSPRTAEWLRTYRRSLEVGVIALAALVLVFWDYPSGLVVLTIAAVAAVVIAVIELSSGRTGGPPESVA